MYPPSSSVGPQAGPLAGPGMRLGVNTPAPEKKKDKADKEKKDKKKGKKD